MRRPTCRSCLLRGKGSTCDVLTVVVQDQCGVSAGQLCQLLGGQLRNLNVGHLWLEIIRLNIIPINTKPLPFIPIDQEGEKERRVQVRENIFESFKGECSEVWQCLFFVANDSYYSSKERRMQGQLTPSVEFDLEDRHFTSEQALLLEFSNTDKKPLAPQDPESLKKMLLFSSAQPTLSLHTESFLEEFNHLFTVTFQSEMEGDGDNAEQCWQPINNEKSKGLSARQGQECDRISQIDFSYPVLAAVPSDMQKKVVKSEIFRKESCFPNFQIKKKTVFKHKSKITVPSDTLKQANDRVPLMPLQPLTCKNNKKGTMLFFTSKATPRDSQLAKRIMKKNGDISGSTRALIEEARMIADKGCIGNGNRQSKLVIKFNKKEQVSKGGRKSEFQRLPSIR